MKKRAALGICFILLCTSAMAIAQVKKTEVVYARLDAMGTVEGVYIVNSFETLEPAQVKDFGRYVKVTNLSGLEPLSYNDEALELSLERGRFYYQGDQGSRELPWIFSIGYSLNGATVAPQALPGADGKLEITLDVGVNEALKAYAQSMTLQITLTLDGDKCLDIQAPKASIASAAGDKTLVYVILPGQSASYTLSAQVEDFAMAGLQIAGVRMAMDLEQYEAVATQALQGSPLAAAVGPLMGNFMGGLQGPEPFSFADARNGAVDSLQFVMLTQGIDEKSKPQQPASSVQHQPETVLTRIMALFGG
jgi:putative membrane protein